MYKISRIKYILQYLVGWMFYSFNYFAEDTNLHKHLQKKYINNFIEKQMVVSVSHKTTTVKSYVRFISRNKHFNVISLTTFR